MFAIDLCTQYTTAYFKSLKIPLSFESFIYGLLSGLHRKQLAASLNYNYTIFT